MLPVWLDEDIADLGAWMLSRVRQVGADDDLPETFIQALYRRKRLLLVAFALDPIAEYVAAFAHAEDCGRDERRWSDLRAKVAEQGDDAAGFGEALRVTHEVYSRDLGWP